MSPHGRVFWYSSCWSGFWRHSTAGIRPFSTPRLALRSSPIYSVSKRVNFSSLRRGKQLLGSLSKCNFEKNGVEWRRQVFLRVNSMESRGLRKRPTARVRGIIFRELWDDFEILLLKRLETAGMFPSLQREIEEETGLIIRRRMMRYVCLFSLDHYYGRPCASPCYSIPAPTGARIVLNSNEASAYEWAQASRFSDFQTTPGTAEMVRAFLAQV